MPGYLTTLSGMASSLVLAVSSQVKTYFESDSRFQREFLFPAVAFVLSCLGLLLIALGPETLRGWWESLAIELKVVVGLLLAILFILVAETSRMLALTVRRLYSGEWPTWPRLQEWLRQPMLEEVQSRDAAITKLARAQAYIITTDEAMAEHYKRPQPGSAAEKAVPVPARPLAAYEAIGPEEWRWQRLAVTGAVVESPKALLCHYTLAPLAPGKPIAAGSLQPLPNRGYLDERRQVLALAVPPEEVAAYLARGDLVDLHLISPRGGAPSRIAEVLLLDRPDPGRLVLAVPAGDVEKLLNWLPQRQLKVVRATRPGLAPEVAVARAKRAIQPGELIQPADVAWTILAEADAVGHSPAPANKVYWPRNVEIKAGALGPPLSAGNVLLEADLRSIDRAGEWLLYESAGKVASKQAYGLTVSGRIRKAVEREYRSGTVVETRSLENLADEEANIQDLAGQGNGSDSQPDGQVQIDYPIQAGDVLALHFYGESETTSSFHSEANCYVYEVDPANKRYVIAVANADSFRRHYQQAKRIVLSPFTSVPVLKNRGHRAQLVDRAQVVSVAFRANLVALRDVCLSDEEVVAHYVLVDAAPLPAFTPIPRRALGPTRPSGWQEITFQDGPIRVRPMLNGGDVLLVSMAPPGEKPYTEKVVCARDQALDMISLQVLKVEVPADCAERFMAAWRRGGPVTVKILDPGEAKVEHNARNWLAVDLESIDGQAALNERLQFEPGEAQGTLADVHLSLNEQQTLAWQGAFVSQAAWDESGQLRQVTVTASPADAELAQSLWSRGAELTLVLRYSDGRLNRALATLEARCPAPEEVVAATGSEIEIVRQATQVKELYQEWLRLNEQVQERPWQGNGPAIDLDFYEDVCRRNSRLHNDLRQYARTLRAAVISVEERRRREQILLLPGQTVDVRPTRFGNVLAAAAEYPYKAYQIDTASILPRLMETLDRKDAVVERLINTESAMNTMLMFSFWSGAWTVTGALMVLSNSTLRATWWVYPLIFGLGPLLWWLMKEAAIGQAFAYGDALKSLFDLRRRQIWIALGIELATDSMTPREEVKYWKHLYGLYAYGHTDDDFPALKMKSEKGG